jgi:hypothetical protein
MATAFWDVCRLVVLALVSINLGVLFEIVRLHYRFASDPAKDFHARLLPSHVWRVGLGTMVLIFSSLVAVNLNFGQPANWRIFTTIIGNALLLWGFVKLVQYQREAAK